MFMVSTLRSLTLNATRVTLNSTVACCASNGATYYATLVCVCVSYIYITYYIYIYGCLW